MVALDGWVNRAAIYGGVEVGGIPVGGKSREEARGILAKSAEGLPEEVTFVSGEKSVTLSAGELDLRFDAERSVEKAFEAGRSGGLLDRIGARLRSVLWRVEVRPRLLYEDDAVRAALEKKPEDAGYRLSPDGSVVVTPGRTGLKIRESFWPELGRRLLEGGVRVEVPLEAVAPDLTTRRAETLRPTDLLASYRTNYLGYDDTPGRVTNLQVVSDAINGTSVAPGEVFSFNEIAEPLDYEKSKVIVRGKVDYADGGGLCQVSSTLYMAANLAGLKTIERHPHHAELPYIRPGFDATVWFGALDMKFQNTTDGYILIQQWVDTGTGSVHAAIYGKPGGVLVSMSSEKVSTTRDEKNKPVTEWVTYKTVTQNGEVLFDGVLHKDTYRYLKEAT